MSMLGIFILVADYSQQIEKATYEVLFRKIEPHPAWSEGSHLAWSSITTAALTEAETSAHTCARSWLNSEIQAWAGRVDKVSKLRGLKDDNNNLINCLVHSKSPLTSRMLVYRRGRFLF